MEETIFGDRLRQARTLRQRKLADLAGPLGCSVPTLSKWEHAGVTEVTARQLAILVESLRFSPSFFLSPPSAPLTDNDLLFKAPKGMPKREAAWLREFVRLLAELLEWMDGQRHLPPVKIRPVSRDAPDVTSAARDLRLALALPPVGPVGYLTHAAERAGVVVAVRRRSTAVATPWAFQADEPAWGVRERHEGCSTWVGEFRDRPFVLMRGVDGWEKTRWVLAHELGHLCLHAGRMPVSELEEEQASLFASELLAPISEVSGELPRVVTLAALLDLKFKWGISLAALIRHLHTNQVITNQRKDTLYQQLYTRRNPDTGRTYGATEPGWDKYEPERPRLIAAWLGHITGTLVPEAVSLATRTFPPDLLASVLNEQRAESDSHGGTRNDGFSGNVIGLGDRAAARRPQARQLRLL
jgi:transcriptional regulator with XRE-family HTH domain